MNFLVEEPGEEQEWRRSWRGSGAIHEMAHRERMAWR
jgi:hypothetical protein